MTKYLTVIELLAIHHAAIESYGGAHGIRDMGALESACYRPQSGYYDDIFSEAAALMESLTVNHPFVDGNKRVAFAAVDIFLEINGYRIVSDSLSIHKWMMQLFETGQFEYAFLEPFLRMNIKKLSD